MTSFSVALITAAAPPRRVAKAACWLLALAALLTLSACACCEHAVGGTPSACLCDCSRGQAAKTPDPRAAYTRTVLTADAQTVPWEVYETRAPGKRPVLLLHDVLGSRPACLELGHDISRMQPGYKVYLPVLFAHFGQEVPRRVGSWTWMDNGPRSLLFGGRDAVQLRGLRALCRELRARHGGQRLTVIGNCLTGGLATALLATGDVNGVVLSQPALPYFPPGAVDVAEPTLRLAVANAAQLTAPAVLALRYKNDKVCHAARMQTLTRRFGCSIDSVELCHVAAGETAAPHQRLLPTGDSRRHSVLIPSESPKLSAEEAAQEKQMLREELRRFLAKRDW